MSVASCRCTFFLLHVGVDVEVECRCDVGVAEYHADGLVVAHAFDASGGETMAGDREFHRGKI